MTLDLVLAIRLVNILLLCLFIGHLLLRFGRKTFTPFFLSWILFWITLILGYVLTLYDFYPFYPYLVNPLLLLISSEFILPDQERSSSKSSTVPKIRIKSSAIFTAISAVSLFVSDDIGYVILNYVSFLSIALFTRKFNQAFPQTNEWIIVALYIYAGLDLHIIVAMYSPEASALTVITALYAPLKVLLYYGGYRVLLRDEVELNSINATQETKVEIQKKVKSKRIAKPLPPVPKVQIQLNGMWGFFYILWRYPSGRVVAMFIFAALITAALAIANNMNTLIALLRK